MPAFPIIDAHVHLYDPGAIPMPWLADVAKIDKPHELDDFSRLTAPVAVDGLVFVEVDVAAGRNLDEARWVEAHGEGDPRLRGIVAAMPLEQGAKAIEADLVAFKALPHARGIRRLIERHADEPGWAVQASFVEAVQSLADHDLPFDICIKHHQLDDAIALVRRCPRVRFVLDHVGKPPIRNGGTEPWRSQLRALAAEPNVHCKISGVVTEADHAAWTYDEVAPYIAHAIDCFGFARVMYGGDWPVSELATDYPRWVAVVDRVTAGVPEPDLRRLYRDTAIAFYRL